MSVHTFDELISHVGHSVEVVQYGIPPVNASIECTTCGCVLTSYDEDEDDLMAPTFDDPALDTPYNHEVMAGSNLVPTPDGLISVTRHASEWTAAADEIADLDHPALTVEDDALTHLRRDIMEALNHG